MVAHMHLHVVFVCSHDCLHAYTQLHADNSIVCTCMNVCISACWQPCCVHVKFTHECSDETQYRTSLVPNSAQKVPMSARLVPNSAQNVPIRTCPNKAQQCLESTQQCTSLCPCTVKALPMSAQIVPMSAQWVPSSAHKSTQQCPIGHHKYPAVLRRCPFCAIDARLVP